MNVTRSAIAAVLSTVSGVKGYAKRPTAIKPGDAWPLPTRWDRGPGDAWSTEWRVLVVLPGSESEAIDAVDSLLPSVVAALDAVAYVDLAQPVSISTDSGDLMALEITARSE